MKTTTCDLCHGTKVNPKNPSRACPGCKPPAAPKREELPEAIQKAMRSYRLGFGPLPKSYVEWHRERAEATLEAMKAEGLRVHSTEMRSDGWLDSMRTLRVVAEKAGKLLDLQWHDGNQEFFVKCDGGGSCPLRLA